MAGEPVRDTHTEHRFVMRAQVGLAYLYALAFLVDLTIILLSPPELSETAKIILLPMLGWLGALVQQHSSYFFARQRPDGPGRDPERAPPAAPQPGSGPDKQQQRGES